MTTRKSARARLLDAADSILFIDGPVNTPVDAILREAGAAPASLYANFGSKEGLIAAALERRLNVWKKVWEEEIERASDPRERLLAIFPALRRYQCDYLTERWCAFCAASAAIPQPPRAIEQVLIDEDDLLVSRLRELAEPIAGERLDELVDQILVVYCGALTLMLRGEYLPAIERAERVAATLLRTWPAPEAES